VELLALDFDGVISDSAPEAWLVTLRTYAALRPGQAVAALRDGAESRSPEEIRADRTYGEFVEMMPLGNGAADFAVALGLVATGRRAADQAAFDRAYRAAGADFVASFHERFYETRARFRVEDPDRWMSLLGPYPEFLEIMRRRAGEVRLAIATAKDRASVLRLLSEYGVDDLFTGEALLDKDAGRSKRAHLASLQERFEVPFEEIVFVDDKVNHLDDVAGLGVQGVLAAWGYNGKREQRLAHASGHRVCSLDDFDDQLFGRQPVPGGPQVESRSRVGRE
jgi:phosphoglycolate phosphatase-like HAD superfamily hydrolase